MEGLIVTKLRRAEHGELEAHVSLGNGSVPVSRRFGSWGTVPDAGGRFRSLRPPVAAELQRRARRFERREER